jgi:hypothetical protein
MHRNNDELIYGGLYEYTWRPKYQRSRLTMTQLEIVINSKTTSKGRKNLEPFFGINKDYNATLSLI